ncbi:DUF6858 family protein [Hydrogenimonas cancrithermarum]|uniref:Uncharacterized protein n=1 Tax=Hydrogenimonas cancrithermarum TaxID=2993563 RepID=A0ABM8FMD3_9BACT|nr:hypothetical protein [Hydrogenimonas cancrithermarum]BDY12917.1 hypothetical protein HCR_12290 [Hydrogenimonas cancrithermarum]BDY13034.1 hypothetical protein HCR_13460 [Hydrogenimonas cancrithermarum]
MTQKVFKEKYPIFELIIDKEETTCKTVDDVIDYFKAKIEEHPVAAYIATFDHYAHTSGLAEGEINEKIKGAKNIVFCFGKELPTPEVMAVRPRSIGVSDMGDKFVVIFMEAPNPQANNAMESWAKALKNA